MSSLRTIQHPGVEIREHDISQYAATLEGTYCLVMGFCDKGEDYEPFVISDLADKITNYGEPTNEAERYLHYAVEEVINNGGVPIIGKLPYQNLQSLNYNCYGIKLTEPDTLSPEVSGNFEKAVSGAVEYYDQYTSLTTSFFSIANEAYDSIKVGNIFGTGTEAYDFLLVDETKSVNSGINSALSADTSKQGLIAIVVDPVDAITVQYAAQNSEDTDISEVITSINGINASELQITLSDEIRKSSLSEDLSKRFPTIEFDSTGNDIVKEYSNHIGVMICRSYFDQQNEGKVNISVVEAFTGSIHKFEKDSSTGISSYIGDVINNNSQYFKWYAKPQNYDVANKEQYNPISNPYLARIDQDVVIINDNSEYALFGFEEADTDKVINGGAIQSEMQKVFDKISNIDEIQLDVVIDAGLSTISQFTADYSGYTDISSLMRVPAYVYNDTNQVYENTTPVVDGDASENNWSGIKYDPSLYKKEITSVDDVLYWRSVVDEMDNFCAKTRKDCMAIIDLPRNLVLEQNQKYIRKTAPDNTITNKIIKKLRYVTGINSSYTAAYITWSKTIDDYSGNEVWLPQTCFMGGLYCNVDANFNYWNDPAGLERGIMNRAIDVAFNPNSREQGQIYLKSINYANKNSLEGVVAWGQKTTQAKKSAFDRVNVRRLFLRLERYVYGVARYFVHRPNNLFTRRNFVDTVSPEFNNVKQAGGMYDFQIVCDTTNNTNDVIDNNEMRAAFFISPVKSAEFIICDFYATRTGADFNEIIKQTL